MVDVVVPLHRHAARPLRDADRCDHVGLVEVRLGNEGQRTADLRGPFGDLRGQLGEDVGLGSVDEGMDGIQTKPVDPVLHQPLVGIVDDELTDGPVVVPVEIHCVAPRGRVMVIEVGAELGQVVPLRSEVVVDDVEDDPEPLGMGSVDELLEAGRSAVRVLGGVEVDAVVSPAPGTGDLGDRHDLDGLHPEFDEVVEMVDGSGEGALLGEGADVHLIEHSSLEVYAVPGGWCARDVHLRWPMDAFGLVSTAWIRQGVTPVQDELVALTGLHRLGECPGGLHREGSEPS